MKEHPWRQSGEARGRAQAERVADYSSSATETDGSLAYYLPPDALVALERMSEHPVELTALKAHNRPGRSSDPGNTTDDRPSRRKRADAEVRVRRTAAPDAPAIEMTPTVAGCFTDRAVGRRDRHWNFGDALGTPRLSNRQVGEVVTDIGE